VQIDEMELRIVVSAAFQQNTYVAWRPNRQDCLVIDPGLEPERIIECLEKEGLAPAAILNTHGHSDHIGGNGALKERWPDCPLVIGADEVEKLTDPTQNLSVMFGANLVSPPADKTVAEGEICSAAGFDLKVSAIPGHSSGHVVFAVQEQNPGVVFVGDVIFQGSIGRTDFPDGDFALLATGIKNKLFSLPDETVLLSGHGPATTVGQERQTNPFVGENAGRL
jgi:glyoxylase-like metal-dependent hydrolase (beta-lactamase superfamily II)